MKERLYGLFGEGAGPKGHGARAQMSHCTKYVGDVPVSTNHNNRNRSPPLPAIPDLKYPFVG